MSPGSYDITPQSPLDRLRKFRENTELRRKTFEKFPASLKCLKEELVDSGFYYMGDGDNDKVQCAFCGGVLSGWISTDDVTTQHRHFYPNCTYALELVLKQKMKERTDCNISEANKVQFPCYSSTESRLSTFTSWPEDPSLPNAESVADAGLFYTGEDDVCQCYACGNQLLDWEPGDDPKEEHDKCFPECFLSQKI